MARRALDAVIGSIGEERFRAACADAWRVARFTGRRRGGELPAESAEVLHDAADAIWSAKVPALERLETIFGLYRCAPSYGVLMYVSTGELTAEERAHLWNHYRTLLMQDDPALAQPACYSLWVDHFENRLTVEEAWKAISTNLASSIALERLLENSGPVPYPLKATMYERLAGEKRWHEWIFRSLLRSATDVYGHVEPKPALALLQVLDISRDTEGLDLLLGRLAGQK